MPETVKAVIQATPAEVVRDENERKLAILRRAQGLGDGGPKLSDTHAEMQYETERAIKLELSGAFAFEKMYPSDQVREVRKQMEEEEKAKRELAKTCRDAAERAQLVNYAYGEDYKRDRENEANAKAEKKVRKDLEEVAQRYGYTSEVFTRRRLLSVSLRFLRTFPFSTFAGDLANFGAAFPDHVLRMEEHFFPIFHHQTLPRMLDVVPADDVSQRAFVHEVRRIQRNCRAVRLLFDDADFHAFTQTHLRVQLIPQVDLFIS